MKHNQTILAAAMGVALATWAFGAQASLIDVGDHLTISGGIEGGALTGFVNNGQGGTAYQNVYSGAFSVDVLNTTKGGPSFSILTFCTDVGTHWNSPRTYEAVQFGGQSGINPAWSVAPEAIQNASYLYNTFFIGQNLDQSQEAGMQLAIWKVLYDTVKGGTIATTAFTDGNFRAYGFGDMAMSEALGYVNAVNAARTGGTFLTYVDTWLKPDSADTQGLIWNANTPPVPEPTTIIAGALLLLPFGASSIRILRKRMA